MRATRSRRLRRGPGRRAGVVEQGSSETGTNVQEAGVDEPDVVKTDGELLARVRDGDAACCST